MKNDVPLNRVKFNLDLPAERNAPMRKRTNCVALVTTASCLCIPLSGCALSQPSQKQVEDTKNSIATLYTPIDGRAYLKAGIDEIDNRKEYLEGIQYGIDGGVLGGVLVTGLGTALKWGSQGNTRAAILTTALVGVDSDLSIKQQVEVLDKALDAMQCVERQAGADWIELAGYDTILGPVDNDIYNLQSYIGKIPDSSITSSSVLEMDIVAANLNIERAQLWLTLSSNPDVTVNSYVQISVDNILQTTVDQLDTVLPDASAFNSISSSFLSHASEGTVRANPTFIQLSDSPTSPDETTIASASNFTKPIDLNVEFEDQLILLSNSLAQDITVASALLTSLPAHGTISFSSVSCPLTFSSS